MLRWDGTQYVPRVEPEPRTEAVSSASSPSAATSPGTAFSPHTGTSPRTGKSPGPRRRRVRWAALAATGALMFGLCMLVVTGFEGITGKPMSGGDGGTTVGSVFRSGPQRPDPAPAVPTAPETSTRPSGQLAPSKQLEPSRQPGSDERSTAPRPSGTRAPTTTERPTGEPAPAPGSATTGAGAPAGGAGERTGTGAPGAEPELEPEIADQPGSSGTGR